MQEQPKVEPTSTFAFAKAIEVMNAGGMVRRKAWKDIVKGVRKGNDRFAILEGGYGLSKWTPYFEDFLATDWFMVKPPPMKTRRDSVPPRTRRSGE